MDSCAETTIGEALASARRGDARIAAPATGWPPADLGTAERIQAGATRGMGEPVVGWKIGATSPEAQRMMGCEAPFFGPLFGSRVYGSGATIPFTPGTLGVECEFAFRIAEDQPTGRSGYDADSIRALVASCHPSLEIVGRRIEGVGFPGVNEAVADFALNVAFVYGPVIEGWRQVDLAGVEVNGFADGRHEKSGHGRNVLGHPLNALAWLANALGARGTGLRAGDWVSTGTCLGVVPAAAGSSVSGEYGPLGRIAVTFAT